MAITVAAVGTIVRGAGAITPIAPAHAANTALVYCTGSIGLSDTLSTPGGWAQQTTVNNGAAGSAFALYDTTGAATIPSVNWSASNEAWAVIVVLAGVNAA